MLICLLLLSYVATIATAKDALNIQDSDSPNVKTDEQPVDMSIIQVETKPDIGQQLYDEAYKILFNLLPKSHSSTDSSSSAPFGNPVATITRLVLDFYRAVSNVAFGLDDSFSSSSGSSSSSSSSGGSSHDDVDTVSGSGDSGNYDGQSGQEMMDMELWTDGGVSVTADMDIPVVAAGDNAAVRKLKAMKMLYMAGYIHGNTDALVLLGDMYLFKRLGHKRNVTIAYNHFYTLAHTHGNSTGQRMLGLMYATGVAVKRDYAKALLYMSFAVLGKDTRAQQILGYWHQAGIATTKSCDDAAWYYKQVADKVIDTYKSGPPGGLTIPPSKTRLSEAEGGVYGPGASGTGSGTGNPQSAMAQQNLREIYELQAESGDFVYQLSLAETYYRGSQIIPRDLKRAYHWYKKVATDAWKELRPQGEVSAQVKQRVQYAGLAAGRLGFMYWRGEYVEQNNKTARQWFERGEELENAIALNGLGMMHLDGAAGFEVDVNKAYQYFSDASQKDDAEAQVNFAELILRTNKADAYGKAFKLYSLAANHVPANIMALYRLGEMNVQGLGTQPNCVSGVSYLKSVVEKGDWFDGSVNRAYRYAKAGDYETALLLYLFAAERGYEVAQTNAAWIIDQGLYDVGKSAGNLFPEGTDPYEIALVLWNRAANQGNVDARVKTGDYHYYGLGVNVRLSLPSKGGAADDGAKLKTGETAAAENVEKIDSKEAGNVGTGLSLIQQVQTAVFKALAPVLPRFLILAGTRGRPMYDRAAVYYQVAADDNSALAQWNMGYMHENGIGVAKDYPLAKRMYDISYATNPDAYLPVNIALAKLFFKQAVSTLSKFIGSLASGRAFHAFLFPEEDLYAYYDKAAKQHVKGAIPPSAMEDAEPAADADEDGILPWGDILLVSGLAGVMAILYLWRQLLSVNEEMARRWAAQVAARVAAQGAAAGGAPAPEAPAAGGVPAPPTNANPPEASSASRTIEEGGQGSSAAGSSTSPPTTDAAGTSGETSGTV
ncbi:ERAD-associated protein [Blyttiomyces sp. JEL0837]|nr:ERAD-associated protein [Blyttiomyces sp. JEL0837]